MAFPSVISFAETNVPTAATNHTGITIPAHNNGDLIVMISGTDGDNTVSARGTVNGVDWTPTFSSGVATNAVSIHAAICYATATQATDITNHAITFSDSETAFHHCYIVRGHHTSVDPEGTFAVDADAVYDPPSLTASWGADDNLWFTGVAIDTSLGTETINSIPANYGNENHANHSSSAGIGMVTCRRQNAVATENPAAATNTNEQWAAFTLVIRGAAGGGEPPQLARPVADTTVGTYVNQVGATTNLYQSIDETSFSDADYVESVVDPVNAPYVTKIDTLSDPAVSTGHVIRYRYLKNGTATINLVVQLRQGYVNESTLGTLIKEWTHNNISGSAVTETQTLSGGEADSITNYGDLYMRFLANKP